MPGVKEPEKAHDHQNPLLVPCTFAEVWFSVFVETS